jgi:hypothetical protein
MKLRCQFGGWWCSLGLSTTLVLTLTLLVSPGAMEAKQKPKERATRPPAAERKVQPPPAPRGNDRPPVVSRDNNPRGNNRPPNGNRNATERFNENRPPRTVGPPPNVQERWRNMTPQEKQRLSQNEERLRRLPPAQQQMLRERAQVWQRMTPQQRDHVRNDVLPKWREMTPDRRQAIQQRLRVLQNMPESARNRRLNDPNFTRGMSEEDRSTLRDLSHLHVGGGPEPPGE